MIWILARYDLRSSSTFCTSTPAVRPCPNERGFQVRRDVTDREMRDILAHAEAQLRVGQLELLDMQRR